MLLPLPSSIMSLRFSLLCKSEGGLSLPTMPCSAQSKLLVKLTNHRLLNWNNWRGMTQRQPLKTATLTPNYSQIPQDLGRDEREGVKWGMDSLGDADVILT